MSITTLDRTAFTALVDDSGTGTDGSVFTKAVFQDIYDKSDALYAAAARCQVFHNTTQSITTSVETALLFNSEDHDDYAMHSTVTNTSRLTIPTGMGGVYLVSAAATFTAAATGTRLIRIRKNGTTFVSSFSSSPANSVGNACVQAHCLVVLAAADYVEATVTQDSGGAINVGHASDRGYQNQFFAVRIL
jgi:hypothetical protein